MPNVQIEKIIKRADKINSSNANWRNYFSELATFSLPRKAWINSRKTKGQALKFNSIYDSTAIRGLKIMAAGFHSNLTNPASKWFNLRTRYLPYMEDKEVQMWFKEVEDKIFATLNSSNFDTTMQEFYLNAGCFGTSTILILEDTRDKVRFTEIPIEQIALEEDAYGIVNRVYRTFPLTVQQAYDLWGDNAGKTVLEKIEATPNEVVSFMHYVAPREQRDASKVDGVNMPYESIWIAVKDASEVAKGGYEDFPYAVGRFYKDVSDVFGYSPTMDVLADIKLINTQTKTILRKAMKDADPALILPRRGFILPLNSNPNAVNYHDANVNADAIKQMPTGGNPSLTLEMMQAVQQNIEKAYFVPLFQAISNVTKTMTIPEVQRRIAENMVLLGPVVGRFTQEVLDPLILRVFNVLFRNGELPMPPESIAGEELDIVYISPLAKAQRETEIYAIESFMQDVSAIAQFKPEALDKINEDRTVDIIAQIKGVNPEMLNSDRIVQGIREARAEAAEAAMQMEMLNQGADAVKKGASAEKDMRVEK